MLTVYDVWLLTHPMACYALLYAILAFHGGLCYVCYWLWKHGYIREVFG